MQDVANLLKLACKWTNCNKVFDSEEQVFDHVKLSHIRAFNETQCSWGNCTTKTATKWNLVTHMNTHLFIVRGACFLCNRTFRWSGDARRHFKQHSQKEKEFNNVVEFLFQ